MLCDTTQLESGSDRSFVVPTHDLLEVEPLIPIEYLIMKSGFDKVDSLIRRHTDIFPIRKTGLYLFKPILLKMDFAVEFFSVERQVGVRGIRPATPHELLVFSIKFPERQREFPIKSAGAVCQYNDGRMALRLEGDENLRELVLHWTGGVRPADVRYLFVEEHK